MRIIQIIQKPQWRGAEIFASQLGNHLLDAGHEVYLISLLEGDATLPFKGNTIKLNRPLGFRFLDVIGWRQLADFIKELQPHVVQANAGDTLKFAVFSKFIFRWKAPIIFRNANKASDFVNSTSKLLFNKFLMSQVSHVISVSELCRLDFIKTYSFERKKTITVPIGIERKKMDDTRPSDLESVFGSSKILVHVASYVPEKNHAGLLQIIKMLLIKGEDVKLLMIGDGKLRDSIQQQIISLDFANHVFLLGYRNDVMNIMQNAFAFILPSNIEGLPGVIFEAMYCRTPVIAYDVGGISEVVKSGMTGWLVKAGDEAGFVSAVLEVLHADNLEEIKDNAYNLVVNEYDNRVIAKRFLEVYKRVAGL